MKWHPFVRMRSSDHLGRISIFLRIAKDKNGFRRMKEEGGTYKTLPQTF